MLHPAWNKTFHLTANTRRALGSQSSLLTVGDLDASIEQVLPLMEAELFGDVAETKEEAAFANKYKEAKALKAYDTYLLLASQITFATHLDVLLIPVRDRLPLAAAPRVRCALYHCVLITSGSTCQAGHWLLCCNQFLESVPGSRECVELMTSVSVFCNRLLDAILSWNRLLVSNLVSLCVARTSFSVAAGIVSVRLLSVGRSSLPYASAMGL